MADIRTALTAVLRRAARLLPADSPVRLALSRGWDRVLTVGGRRHMPVRWAGRSFQLQVRFRRLDPGYEADAAAVWAALLSEGQTAWDVGGNFGLYTLLSAAVVGPAGRVVAWEPSPATHAILADHVVANGLADRVRVIQAAVADRAGTTTFRADATGTDPTGRISADGTLRVPVGTLDGFAAEVGPRPDAVKIDVEGAEVLALRGAAGLLGPGGARPAVLLAVHPQFLPEFGTAPAELEELLARYEYDCFTPTGGATRPTEYNEYLCLPRERSAALLGRLPRPAR